MTDAAGAWHRLLMRKRSIFALVCGLSLVAACSSTPKAEDASNKTDDQAQSETSEHVSTGAPEDTGSTGQAASSGVKVNGVERTDDNSVPDDYSLTERDCDLLGKKLGDLWRGELRSQMSPKLSDKQREKAEQSIEDGASKKEDDWAAGCIKGLAGKTVDPKTLKCAFNSKDLKAFEKCLN